MMKGLGTTYQPRTGIRKTREWRGVKDTACDFFWWLITWKDMAAFVLRSPAKFVKGLRKYRWMAACLTVPAFIDRQLEGSRGVQLRAGRLLCDVMVKRSIDILSTVLSADQRIGGNRTLSERIVCLDGLVPAELMCGFPNLIGIPVQTASVLLASMANRQLRPAEAGAAVEEDFPRFGKCYISCSGPCDGSVTTGTRQDRRFGLPTCELGVPLRDNGEAGAQDGAVEELLGCIRFIEQQTGEKFDWDAFFDGIEAYNELTRFHLALCDINRTRYPQVTGSVPWLYRMASFRLHGGTDDRFLRANEKVRRLMRAGCEKRLPCARAFRHKALLWSWPAMGYTGFTSWLELCWGIVCVADTEASFSRQIIETSSPRRALEGLALTLARAAMCGHTGGVCENAPDALWRAAEEYGADMVIVYDSLSCGGADALRDTLDGQARAHRLKLIRLRWDLTDGRTVSRRDIRNQVNLYMRSVLHEQPLDPTLVDLDDSEVW